MVSGDQELESSRAGGSGSGSLIHMLVGLIGGRGPASKVAAHVPGTHRAWCWLSAGVPSSSSCLALPWAAQGPHGMAVGSHQSNCSKRPKSKLKCLLRLCVMNHVLLTYSICHTEQPCYKVRGNEGQDSVWQVRHLSCLQNSRRHP